eukprot:TRINITY_DN20024_c0_g1_i1.p1 TRINITY_DN20024_c0_g1~~TRINITY_DN20024_c0_g1_i1.p1  ORF type:complete len:312 (-),score=47.27 TRINITY_DN20024_c0_g1_i1:241-1176(-)
MAPNEPLEYPWVEANNDEGTYFFNEQTGESEWQRPCTANAENHGQGTFTRVEILKDSKRLRAGKVLDVVGWPTDGEAVTVRIGQQREFKLHFHREGVQWRRICEASDHEQDAALEEDVVAFRDEEEHFEDGDVGCSGSEQDVLGFYDELPQRQNRCLSQANTPRTRACDGIEFIEVLKDGEHYRQGQILPVVGMSRSGASLKADLRSDDRITTFTFSFAQEGTKWRRVPTSKDISNSGSRSSSVSTTSTGGARGMASSGSRPSDCQPVACSASRVVPSARPVADINVRERVAPSMAPHIKRQRADERGGYR